VRRHSECRPTRDVLPGRGRVGSALHCMRPRDPALTHPVKCDVTAYLLSLTHPCWRPEQVPWIWMTPEDSDSTAGEKENERRYRERGAVQREGGMVLEQRRRGGVKVDQPGYTYFSGRHPPAEHGGGRTGWPVRPRNTIQHLCRHDYRTLTHQPSGVARADGDAGGRRSGRRRRRRGPRAQRRYYDFKKGKVRTCSPV
jgi:hypothetical protein